MKNECCVGAELSAYVLSCTDLSNYKDKLEVRGYDLKEIEKLKRNQQVFPCHPESDVHFAEKVEDLLGLNFTSPITVPQLDDDGFIFIFILFYFILFYFI